LSVNNIILGVGYWIITDQISETDRHHCSFNMLMDLQNFWNFGKWSHWQAC